MIPSEGPTPRDIDAAVARSIAKLTDGRFMPFADQQQPPAEIVDWIANASLPQTHAVLCLALHRWHEVRAAD